MNLKWPSTQDNDFVPRYVFLRRALFWTPFQVFRMLAWFFVMLGWGWENAKFWREESV